MDRKTRHLVCKLLAVSVLLSYGVVCFGGKHPSASLTLIPPSPVTDKITLDIRAAVWNRSDKAGTYHVYLYLDDENDKSLLHKEIVKVPPRSCEGIRFDWSTNGYAGKHRLLLVADCGTENFRASRPLEIIKSDIRSTQSIEGAWVEFYHWSKAEGRLWNKDIKKMTDEQWRELVGGMHGIGMDVIVIQDVFRGANHYVDKHNMTLESYDGKAMYPSRLYPSRFGLAAKDPVEAVLTEADKLGMHVFLGVGGYAWFDFSEGSLAWHKAVATELWEMYGHHRSFYGWYISDEVEGGLASGARDEPTMSRRHKQIVDFFREFKLHVRQMAPDKPVMLATNSGGIKYGMKVYPKLLKHLDILCPFGFHRLQDELTGNEQAKVLQELCDEAGAHLWMDLEVFLFASGSALYPRPIEAIADDLRVFTNFEKILCYSFTGLMNSPDQSCAPGGAATVRLYNEYAKYLEDGVPDYCVEHVCVGKSVELRSKLSPRYSKGNLTNGVRASRDYLCKEWLGFEDQDFEAVVDLGEVVSINKIQAAFLEFKTGAIFLPEKVEFSFSVNGKDFEESVVIKNDSSSDEFISHVHVFEKDNLNRNARYVRAFAESAGQWLFVDEIIVNPIGQSLKEL